MAYIQPNSTVQFFPDLGLSANYENTLYFASVQAKDAYFSGLTPITTVNSVSYVREIQGVIRVEKPISTLYNVGYMRYKNTSFENKWFYAFVTKVNYINNITTEVEFEIDVLMTWQGAFTLKQCFIERQHTPADVIGGNIVEENLETGEYVVETHSKTGRFDNYKIAIYQATDDEGNPPIGLEYGGMFSGLYVHIETSATGASAHIQEMMEDPKTKDAIVMIQILPDHFLPGEGGSSSPTMDRFQVTTPYDSIDGYIPRNKKLFTYPYKMLTVYNTEGEAANFRYEFFGGKPNINNTPHTCSFVMRGVVGPQTEISMIPENYKGLDVNYSERLNMINFPQCAWTSDTYRAYIAQLQSGLGVSLVSSALQAGAGVLMGNPLPVVSGISSALSQTTNLVATQIIHPPMPVQAKGSQTNDLLVGMKEKDFYFYRMSITQEYARIIDHYFDLYGYAIRSHSTPNMHTRERWTYVKTIGCCIDGRIPADDARQIENIFDSGVRFWTSHTDIGNYSLSNNPL